MCKVNFFEDKYIKEDYRNDSEFGLCDDGKIAYSDSSNNINWIATVANTKNKDILFIPPSMAEMLAEPSIIPFLMDKRNTILLIEDAEKVISDNSESSLLIL